MIVRFVQKLKSNRGTNFQPKIEMLHYRLEQELEFHITTNLEISYPFAQDAETDPWHKDFTGAV